MVHPSRHWRSWFGICLGRLTRGRFMHFQLEGDLSRPSTHWRVCTGSLTGPGMPQYSPQGKPEVTEERGMGLGLPAFTPPVNLNSDKQLLMAGWCSLRLWSVQRFYILYLICHKGGRRWTCYCYRKPLKMNRLSPLMHHKIWSSLHLSHIYFRWLQINENNILSLLNTPVKHS